MELNKFQITKRNLRTVGGRGHGIGTIKYEIEKQIKSWKKIDETSRKTKKTTSEE